MALETAIAELSEREIVEAAPLLLETLIEQGRRDDADALLNATLQMVRRAKRSERDMLVLVPAQISLGGRDAAIALWREVLDRLTGQRRLSILAKDLVAAALAVDRVDELLDIPGLDNQSRQLVVANLVAALPSHSHIERGRQRTRPRGAGS